MANENLVARFFTFSLLHIVLQLQRRPLLSSLLLSLRSNCNAIRVRLHRSYIHFNIKNLNQKKYIYKANNNETNNI